jgi:hypothetical protein
MLPYTSHNLTVAIAIHGFRDWTSGSQRHTLPSIVLDLEDRGGDTWMGADGLRRLQASDIARRDEPSYRSSSP